MTKKNQKPIFYKVKLEVLAPIELHYRVRATSPEEAIDKIKYGVLLQSKPKISLNRKIKATVYKYGSMIIEYVKNY